MLISIRFLVRVFFLQLRTSCSTKLSSVDLFASLAKAKSDKGFTFSKKEIVSLWFCWSICRPIQHINYCSARTEVAFFRFQQSKQHMLELIDRYSPVWSGCKWRILTFSSGISSTTKCSAIFQSDSQDSHSVQDRASYCWGFKKNNIDCSKAEASFAFEDRVFFTQSCSQD